MERNQCLHYSLTNKYARNNLKIGVPVWSSELWEQKWKNQLNQTLGSVVTTKKLPKNAPNTLEIEVFLDYREAIFKKRANT